MTINTNLSTKYSKNNINRKVQIRGKTGKTVEITLTLSQERIKA
jgi:hypothetical protein